MKEYNKYIKAWQDLSIKLNEAMQKDDFRLADKLMSESVETYKKYKECCSYPSSNRSKTFGELNYMLESELPDMFKTNKNALKDCTLLIKEDKNLRNAFRFIDSLRNYNCDGDSRKYVTESLELASEDIDKKSFKESVKKLADLLSKYEIGTCNLDEETIQYFKACDKALCEKKSLSNLTEYTNSINTISSYIENHKAPVNESKNDIFVVSEEFERKIANLTEEEQSLVKDIIDFKNPIIETKQQNLFNRFKDECLNVVNNLIKEASTEDKEGLMSIKEHLEEKKYNKETIVEDIVKLLEIRDVLNEK